MSMPAFAIPRHPVEQESISSQFLKWVRPLDSNNLFFSAPEADQDVERIDPEDQGPPGSNVVTPPDEERLNTDFEGDRPNQG